MNPVPRLSVIIPAHNPHAGRLGRTLAALQLQTLPVTDWETLLVDNASDPAVESAALADSAPANLRLILEPQLGLSSARSRGFTEARGDLAVLVDDDNVLAPDYLTTVLQLFQAHPRVGLLGGKSIPEFAEPPPAWTAEFHPLLALRDLGPAPLVSTGLRPPGSTRNEYPVFAPIGAGMALRRPAWEAWLQSPTRSALSDRRGGELTSSGDNDIVMCAMGAGWDVGYFPTLSLTHLIPSSRLDPAYLARINRGIHKSWMQLLRHHDANLWPMLSPVGVRLRQAKAWLTYRAWSGHASYIRWQGACGHFEGRTLPDTGHLA